MTALPYVTSPGNIEKALNAIKSAAVPERVTQDFVKTILKIKGGSGAQMTSFLKKIGFSDSAGTPTDRYRRFRNPSTSGFTVAEAIKEAYAPLFEYNEYVFDLPDNEVVGIIVEVTGHPHDSNPVKLSFSSFKSLKNLADFSKADHVELSDEHSSMPRNGTLELARSSEPSVDTSSAGIGLNLGYTININLPATDDVRVFDAIFTSIKKNLMSREDG
tara:strand:+ start:173 stop:823 length:651 start_codon:yes stop_codon:yes gene_type:complete